MKKDFRQIFSAMHPHERRATGTVALIAMSRMFGLFALLPVLALYAQDLDGATPLLIGFAVGGYGLTQAALQIPFGALSDRLGRVPVIVFGLVVFAAGSVLAGLSETIYGVIAGRLLQGAGAISATLTALLADATRAEMRTRSMAIMGIGIGTSFLLALIIGPVIAAAFGARSLFWLAAGLAVAAMLLLLLLPRGIERPAATSRPGLSVAFRADLLRLDFYVFVLHTLLTASFVALPFLLQNVLALPLGSHWKMYVGALVISLVGTVPLIAADERQGKSFTFSIAVLLLVAGQFVLTFAGTSIAMVLAALAIFFAGFNFLEAGLPARLSILAAGTLRGASLGVFSSAQFLGAFAGGILGGQLMANGNPAAVFLACGVAGLIWLAVLRLYPEPALEAPKPVETATKPG